MYKDLLIIMNNHIFRISDKLAVPETPTSASSGEIVDVTSTPSQDPTSTPEVVQSDEYKLVSSKVADMTVDAALMLSEVNSICQSIGYKHEVNLADRVKKVVQMSNALHGKVDEVGGDVAAMRLTETKQPDPTEVQLGLSSQDHNREGQPQDDIEQTTDEGNQERTGETSDNEGNSEEVADDETGEDEIISGSDEIDDEDEEEEEEDSDNSSDTCLSSVSQDSLNEQNMLVLNHIVIGNHIN